MAPEAIQTRRVTSECDVWSFGILVWELFSLGEVPYKGELTRMCSQVSPKPPSARLKDLLVDSTAGFLSALHSGVRASPPDSCPSEVAGVMTSCWDMDPADRPSFAELAQRMDAFLDPGYTHRYQVWNEHFFT